MQHYVRATSVRHALQLLHEHHSAAIVAGGQSVLVDRPQTPLLIDIGRLDELDHLHVDNDELVLGPLVRLDRLASSPLVRDHSPLLAHCAAQMGDPQLRHQATLGGALCADLRWTEPVPVALALLAVMRLETGAGHTLLDMGRFLTRKVSPQSATGVVTQIRIPPGNARWGYARHSQRNWGPPDMIVATAQGRVVVSDAPFTPVRATAVESVLRATGDPARAARLVAGLIAPGSPPKTPSPAAHRRRVAEALTIRALTQAGW